MPKPKLSIKSKGFRTITHPVPTDYDAVIAHLTAQETLNKARGRALHADQIAELEAAVEEAEQRVRDTTIVVKMRALPQHEYAKVKAAHPPKDEDHKKAREESDNPKAKARWHAATFEPLIVSACMIEPETVTVDEAAEMARTWNEAEWAALVGAAVQVNEYATVAAGLVFS